jgi:tRNA(fMet)-specific endonuclease VapC
MSYLLDTDTCSVYLNGRSPGVLQHFQQHSPKEIFLCAVVKAELFYGAMKSTVPQKQLAKLQHFFGPLVSLPFDDHCAMIYGQIRAHLAILGTPIGPNDLLIAAIALVHGVTLVTHNTGEFSRVPGLHIEDWHVPSP